MFNAALEGAANPLESRRILVVEDELLVRMVIADFLRDEGLAVIEAYNGEEAIGILTAGAAIDLVFTDVRMPGTVDGLEVLRFVRRTHPHIPVVLTSGHLDPSLAQAEGAVAFLPKPCELNAVVDAIRTALDHEV